MRALGRATPHEDRTLDEIDPSRSPEELVASLVHLLELEPIEVDLFRGGRTDEPWTRVFGGQVVAAAFAARLFHAAGRPEPADRLSGQPRP